MPVVQPGYPLVQGISRNEARWGIAGGRIVRDDATTLAYRRWSAEVIEVQDELVAIDETAGIATDLTADNVIDGTGADGAALPAADTLHFAYISNSQASYAPLSLRLSTTAPTKEDGIDYLGPTGNARNWRCVGAVYLDSSAELVDTLAYRGVANIDNVVATPMLATPERVDDNAETTFALNSAAWGAIGNGARCEFVSLGRHGVYAFAVVTASLIGAGQFHFGIEARDGSGTFIDLCAAKLPAAAAHTSASAALAVDMPADTMGLANLTLTAMSSGVNSLLVADGARNGLTADPPMTYLTAWTML